MKTLNHPTGLANGERVRFIGTRALLTWPNPGDILTVRPPETKESEFKSLDYHHTLSGHEYVWCVKKDGAQFLARREDLEA